MEKAPFEAPSVVPLESFSSPNCLRNSNLLDFNFQVTG
jgi:hypothetical protein